MDDPVKPEKSQRTSKTSFDDRRRAARVAAVQALYQLEHSEKPNLEAVLRDFVMFRSKENLEGLKLGKFDKNLFFDLVTGVWKQREAFDDMAAAVLPEGWVLERTDPVVKNILRLGVQELSQAPDRPISAIVSEYVAIAGGFFEGNEPRVINGALNTVAKLLRDGEAPEY